MNYVGSATRLNKRNISEKTCEKFKIYRDGETLRFYYHNADGQCIGAKTRSKSKVFSYEGETDGSFSVNIYGDLKVSELQLLKASLMRRHVLRSHQLGQWYRFHLVQLQQRSRFRRIYNFFRAMTKSSFSLITMKAGIEAAKNAATVLPPGKVLLARLNDYKDASDALQAGDYDALTRAYWDAKPFRPDGIVDCKTLLDLVTSPQPPANHDYPYQGLQKILHGVRYGELVTITAGSGIGKSSFVESWLHHSFRMVSVSVTLLLKNQTDELL